MTTVVKPRKIMDRLHRATREALEQGFMRLIPSALFGEHRSFTASELGELHYFLIEELGISSQLLNHLVSSHANLNVDRWSEVGICPCQDELKLEAMRVHTGGPDGEVRIDFALKRLPEH